MKNLTNYQDPLSKTQVVSNVKLLLFDVGKLNVALPINSVKKVLNYTPVYSSGMSYTGIAHLEDIEITVVDLHKKIFNENQQVESGKRGYLILARNTIGESFGIWVATTPTLIDVPSNLIRQLPESYRRADTLAIASHVTVIEEKEQSLTVFILDCDTLVPPVTVSVR